MLRIDRQQQTFTLLSNPTLAEVAISERYDLQEFICNSPQAFFQELGLDLLLIGKEIMPSKNVQDRIDLLTIDREGNCVILELKRDTNKLQLLQAVSYAGMLSQWTAEDLLQLLDEPARERLADFLEVDIDEINRAQRIVLIAEAFDYALLVGTEWLSKNYGVDVVCCRVSLAKDPDSGAEYLVCSNVYPAPELFQEAAPRGRRTTGAARTKWADWDAVLAEVSNPAVVDFFRQQVAGGQENNPRYRVLHFRADGKRRWTVFIRQKGCFVRQRGRFDKDLEFWQAGVNDPSSVKPIRSGKCVRLSLTTEQDFQFFLDAATRQLLSIQWTTGVEDEPDEEELGE